MDASPARPLIIIGGLLAIAYDLFTLLPGNPDFTSGWGAVGAVVLQALVLWGLLRRSGLAWAVAFLGSFALPAGLWLSGVDWTPTEIAVSFVSLLQLGILVTPPVLVYVFGGDRAVASHR